MYNILFTMKMKRIQPKAFKKLMSINLNKICRTHVDRIPDRIQQFMQYTDYVQVFAIACTAAPSDTLSLQKHALDMSETLIIYNKCLP